MFFYLLLIYLNVTANAIHSVPFSQDNQFDLNKIQQIEKLNQKIQADNKTCIFQVFLKNSNPEEIKANLSDLFPNILVTVNQRTKSLTINTNITTFKEIKALIKKLDRPLILNTPTTNKKENASVLSIHTIYLKNGKPKDIKDALALIYPQIAIAIDERTRSITLKTNTQTIKEINQIIKKIDCALPQIKIEVKILEVSYSDYNQYKNIFSDLTDGFKINYDFKTGLIGGNFNIEGTLMYLVTTGQAKILAKPVISMIDNNKANIKVGDQVPYISAVTKNNIQLNEIKYLDTGIELEIESKITSPNEICVDINASISSIKLWKEIKEFIYPIISTRKTQTRVKLKNKETLVIAGLFNEETKTNDKKVPILSDLSLVGELFKSKTEEKIKSDIIFLITPEIF
ncbi:MAG: secretin N-terminal domain-containing protein [Candidatus Margulisiibacteriota bacterium]